MERAKASAHRDGSGLQHGVNVCGFRQQLAWLSRKELHDQAAASCAAERVRRALRRTLPEILTEGTEAEETMLRRVTPQCQCNPTGGMFSVTEKWRAKEEEQHTTAARFWMRGLVPTTWTAMEDGETNPFCVWSDDVEA